MHSSLALTLKGRPLGLTAAKFWTRTKYKGTWTLTLIKLPKRGTAKVHVRFKGGKTRTLIIISPKSSAQLDKTNPAVFELIDKLLDDYISSEIAVKSPWIAGGK